jgi:dTDP-4-dehydrorhamnose 3,5-epimerase
MEFELAVTSVKPEILAFSETLELVVAQCSFGIGDVILRPDSDKLIEGVRIQPLSVWPDDRGYFLELIRGGKAPVEGFNWTNTQVSAALSYPGTVKAFHYHLEQSDCWNAVAGMFQFVLADLRQGSRTYGARNTMYVGPLRPWQVLIPPGVAHGYKVIGPEPGVLVYATDRFYNPKDEGRIPYNDSRLAYDWETQHK